MPPPRTRLRSGACADRRVKGAARDILHRRRSSGLRRLPPDLRAGAGPRRHPTPVIPSGSAHCVLGPVDGVNHLVPTRARGLAGLV